VLIHDIACSNNCAFCRAGSKDLPADLERAAQGKLHHDTLGVLGQGLRNLNVSGNEPLAYSKIVAYLDWIPPRFDRITLLDPGNRLEDESLARAVAATGVDTFDPGFARIRDAVLDLADVEDLALRLRYIPPCIFDDVQLERLARRGGIELSNVHFDYRFAESAPNRDQLEYATRYRRQAFHGGCDGCALRAEQTCSGILEMHLLANRDFELNPITTGAAGRIRHMLRDLAVND
jgi:hypothetical protein